MHVWMDEGNYVQRLENTPGDHEVSLGWPKSTLHCPAWGRWDKKDSEHHSAAEPTVADGHIWKKVEPREKGVLKASWKWRYAPPNVTQEGWAHKKKEEEEREPEVQIPTGPFQSGQKPAGGEKSGTLVVAKEDLGVYLRRQMELKENISPLDPLAMFPSQLLQLQSLSFYPWSWAKCYTKQKHRTLTWNEEEDQRFVVKTGSVNHERNSHSLAYGFSPAAMDHKSIP